MTHLVLEPLSSFRSYPLEEMIARAQARETRRSQSLDEEPDAGVPTTLLGAEEEQGMVLLLRSGGDRLRDQCSVLS
jgi:hypothetical protein